MTFYNINMFILFCVNPLIQIFTDSENILTQSSPHTGLLWALETLAWSPEYLSQSALLLASLARLDPGGKLSNRPLGSLREIFLIWHPCTTADLEQRLVVLDTVRRREPFVAWDLMVKLLPGSHNMAFPTAKPRHRNWLAEEETHVPFVEISRVITDIVLRLLEDVGVDGARWGDLIRLLDDLPKPEFDVVTDRLLRINPDSFNEPDRSLIWEALRHLLSKHLQLPDAKWTLPTAAIERLRQCYERFEPENPIQKRNWLFSNRCSFPEGGASRGRERDNIIDQARIKAVEELFDEGGLQMLIDLVCQAEDAYLVGVALGKSRISDGQEGSFLKQMLGSTEPARSIAAFGFLFGCTSIKGQEWLRSLRSSKFWEEWTSKQRADYYVSLPFDEITWDALDAEGDEIHRRYWLEVGINGRGDLEPKDCERIVSKLTEYGRIETAVDFMALYRRKLCNCPNLVAAVLENAIEGKNSGKVNWGSLGYGVGELLNLLEASKKIDKPQLAKFEWYFLPLLKDHLRPPKILHEELAENPEFFMEVLKLLYPAEGDAPSESTKEMRIRAQFAFDLFQSWRRPPGVNEDGSVNPVKLRFWVDKVRKLAQSSDLGVTADGQIGQILANYPVGTDSAWPQEALRDLLEKLISDDIENGIVIGIYNNSRVTIRSTRETGTQERDIVERYASFARIMRDRWPRTARLMKKISSSYESDAKREEKNAELNEDMGRYSQ